MIGLRGSPMVYTGCPKPITISFRSTIRRRSPPLSLPMVSSAAKEPAKPAVSVKKSMTPEYLVCLEDGKRFKAYVDHVAKERAGRGGPWRDFYHAARALRLV